MEAPSLSTPWINWQTDFFQGLRHCYPLFSITFSLINTEEATCVVSVNATKCRKKSTEVSALWGDGQRHLSCL